MLITFLVFACCLLCMLMYLLWRLWPDTRSATTVPGHHAVNTALGNLYNIRDTGSLPQFLVELHEEFGPVASFWLGPFLSVSVGQEACIRLLDRGRINSPVYETALPLTTGLLACDSSFDPTTDFSPKTKYILNNFKPFVNDTKNLNTEDIASFTQELVSTWSGLSSEDHVPVTEYMTALATKIYARSFLNQEGHFSSNKHIGELLSSYTKLVAKVEDSQNLNLLDADARKLVDALNAKIDAFVAVVAKSQRSASSTDLLKVAGEAFWEINSLGCLLSWSLHYLSLDDELSNSLKRENRASMLKFMKEILRVTAFVPYRARILEEELTILGHKLEVGTVVFSSYCRVCQDPSLYPAPSHLEVERDNTDIPTPLQSFPGFDFNSFVVSATITVLHKLLETFQLRPSFGVENPGLKYGLVATPRSEIWIKVQRK